MEAEQVWVAHPAGNVAPKPKRPFWGRLRRVRYGEAVLWLLFALALLASADSSPDPSYMAGLFALVAIGVRATRSPRSSDD